MSGHGIRIRHAKPLAHLISQRSQAHARTHASFPAASNDQNTAAARTLIDTLIPRSRFASSVFTTPSLLFFRLFFQATSFENCDVPLPQTTPHVTFRESLWKIWSAVKISTSSKRMQTNLVYDLDSTFEISSKTPTEHWCTILRSGQYGIAPTSTILSMTWVKSLSAPLSHEFLQFVIECPRSGQQYRLITERDTDGDWAYFIASASLDTSQDRNAITQLRQYDYQHDVPLPLLSASWSRLPISRRPTLLQLTATCEEISKLSPGYNFMRQHCWWYAEKLFERMLGQSPPDTSPTTSSTARPELKHWPWGVYRYSYIVLGKRLLRRDALIEQAKKFRKDMDQDGRLHW